MWRFALGIVGFFVFHLAALMMAPPAFRLERHGVFGLGAQQYKKAWLHKAGLLFYAIVTAVNLVLDFIHWRAPHTVIFLLFVAMILFALSAFTAVLPFLPSKRGDLDLQLTHHRLIIAAEAFVLATILFTTVTESNGIAIFFNLGFAFVIFAANLVARRDTLYRGLYQSLALFFAMLWPLLLYPAY